MMSATCKPLGPRSATKGQWHGGIERRCQKPRRFDSRFKLSEALNELGMPAAFSDWADFSRMMGSSDLFISEVIHKTFVSVDEQGTEAAAAKAEVMAGSVMPADPVAIDMDHPFIFLICDIET